MARLDADAEDTLFLILRRLQRASASVDTFIQRHDDVYRVVCALVGRNWLVDETERLRGAVEPYLRPYLVQSGQARSGAEEHARLLDALVTRDPDRAERAWRHHILPTTPEQLDISHNMPPA